MSVARNIRHFLILSALLLTALWPAILNGYPLFGSDTPAYIRYVDAGVAKILGRAPEWPSYALSGVPRPTTVPSTSGSADATSVGTTPFLGRSVYYGALLEVGNAAGAPWISIALQAAALLLTIALTLQLEIGFDRVAFAGLVVVLSLTTPIAFFASFLMPDLFAGVSILGAAALIVYGDKMTLANLLAWMGLLGASLLFHSSHVVVAMGLLAGCLIARALFRTPLSTRGAVAIALGLALAFAGDSAVIAMTSKMFGVKPIRPPFLMARLIADGPGAGFLRDHCPEAGFTACRFTDRFPVDSAEVFLWSPDPVSGFFTAADAGTRRALSEEQFSFTLAVIRYDPLGVAAGAVRNTMIQSSMVMLTFFNLNDQDRVALGNAVPTALLRVLEATRSWTDTLPLQSISIVVLIVLIAASCCLAVALVRWTKVAGPGRGLRSFCVIVVFGVLLNAFVCGAMSDPFDRYQTRVIWLIPLLASLCLLAHLRPNKVNPDPGPCIQAHHRSNVRAHDRGPAAHQAQPVDHSV